MDTLRKRNRDSEKKDYFYPILITVCAIVFCVWYYINQTSYITSHNAIVEGKLIQISSRISGPVLHLNVEENQEVCKGDVLLEIDPTDCEQRLKIVEYNLKEARRKLYEYELKHKEELQNNPQFFNTSKSLRRYGFSQTDFGTYDTGALPEIVPDKSTLTKDSDKKIAEAKAKAEKEKLAKEQKGLPVLKDMNPMPPEDGETVDDDDNVDPQKLAKDIQKFESDIEQMKLDLSYSKICAPRDGVISVISVPEGGFVDAGEIIISIIPKRVWVSASVPASQLDNLSIGQPVIVKIKKYRGRKFQATVDDFVTKDPKGENNGMVPVRIMFTEDYSEYDIPPGTPAVAMIKIR